MVPSKSNRINEDPLRPQFPEKEDLLAIQYQRAAKETAMNTAEMSKRYFTGGSRLEFATPSVEKRKVSCTKSDQGLTSLLFFNHKEVSYGQRRSSTDLN